MESHHQTTPAHQSSLSPPQESNQGQLAHDRFRGPDPDASSITGRASDGRSMAALAESNQRSGTPVLPSQRLDLMPPAADLADKEKARLILKAATDAFAKTGSWVVFYRAVLGRDGVVRRTFDTEAKFTAFQDMPQYAELQEMVAALRSQDTAKGDAVEPEKMITIRLPESLHQVLTDEADSMSLSINKLCISKLLQTVESRFVPVQQGRRRGRRPGPQGSRKKEA